MSSAKNNPVPMSPEKKAFIKKQSEAFLKNNGLVMVSFFDYPDYGNLCEPEGCSVYLVPLSMKHCLHSEAREHGIFLHSS